jgi:hypothetical protein
LRTTVLPATSAEDVAPTMIAQVKFQGGMTAPTLSGVEQVILLSGGRYQR